MIKVIDNRRYNTETATLVYSHSNMLTESDFRFRQKHLYLSPKGQWFIHHRGGPLTDMSVTRGNATYGNADIELVSEDDAYRLLEAHSTDDDALEAIELHFANRMEEG